MTISLLASRPLSRQLDRGHVHTGVDLGFFSRMFVPRGLRRAMHPARTVKRAITPKPIKQLRRAMHPVDNAAYAFERSLTTKRTRRPSSAVYRHGSCPVKHRTSEAAARCRRA